MKNSNKKKKIQLPVVQNGRNVVVVRNKERRMNWVLPEYIYIYIPVHGCVFLFTYKHPTQHRYKRKGPTDS